MGRVAEDSGVHICLRAPDTASVDAFHAAALEAGGASDGPPGPRPHYYEWYYAAFIRDPDGNRIEAVTFLRIRPSSRRTGGVGLRRRARKHGGLSCRYLYLDTIPPMGVWVMGHVLKRSCCLVTLGILCFACSGAPHPGRPLLHL